jgi:hypothetical protein
MWGLGRILRRDRSATGRILFVLLGVGVDGRLGRLLRPGVLAGTVPSAILATWFTTVVTRVPAGLVDRRG